VRVGTSWISRITAGTDYNFEAAMASPACWSSHGLHSNECADDPWL